MSTLPPNSTLSSSIDAASVQHVAKLARLKITEAEAATFAQQMSTILRAFNELAKIDTSGVTALVAPTAILQRLRADEIQPRLTPDQILANAPEKSGHLFKVPPVV